MEKGKNKIDINSYTINEDSDDVENTRNQVASTPHNNENHSSSFYSFSKLKSITKLSDTYKIPYKIGYTIVATSWNYF
ncbi:553_t:CDS:1, partial [Funneliformis caledonium]